MIKKRIVVFILMLVIIMNIGTVYAKTDSEKELKKDYKVEEITMENVPEDILDQLDLSDDSMLQSLETSGLKNNSLRGKIKKINLNNSNAKAAFEDFGIELVNFDKFESGELIRDELVIYIFKGTNTTENDMLPEVRSVTPDYRMIVVTDSYYTPSTNKASILSMSHALDVFWSISLGTYTNYVWRVATVVGLNPSDFNTSAVPGDTITQRYHYKWYYKNHQVEDPNSSGSWFTTCKTESLNRLTNYLDTYAIDIYGNPIEKHENDIKGPFYSPHYNDDRWGRSTAIHEYEMFSGMSCVQEHIE